MKRVTTFSSRLRDIMKERGIRQSDLLRACASFRDENGHSLSQSSLSQYYRGERIPGPARLQMIASVLGVNEYFLMGYDTDMDPDGEEFQKPSLKTIPTDAFDSAMRWLKENGWKIDQDKENGNYRIRMAGWTYDRTLTISEKEMTLKLGLLIGYSNFLMTSHLEVDLQEPTK
ncbi:MAG: helix-turn-helix domain-containing protein [Lachnospiraceae bacterium]|nr:helix-turn-helix domain-containing protein [Lachnospiraceae bacterium]